MFKELISSSGKRYLFDFLLNDFYELEQDFNVQKNSSRNDMGLMEFKRSLAQTEDLISKKSLKQAKTLIIEITEQCNLRCTYCVFDEEYSSERSHSAKKINLDVARDAIKSFSTRSADKAYIVFYGGEPLLEFDAIKELTDFSKEFFEDVSFSFTTNGTPLTHEKLNFLVENNFLITVSIDGSKKNHDSRRITVNGNPSWDRISNNLLYIKENYSDFYAKNIIFNAVLEDVSEIDDANSEAKNNQLFSKNKVRYSFTLQKNIELTEKVVDFFKKNKSSLRAKIMSNDLDSFAEDRILFLVQRIAFREIGENAENGKKKCIPFANRTYVRSNGDIQFCERISNFSRVSKSDLDIAEHSSKIITKFNSLKESECGSCFAYNFCELCPASFYSDGVFNGEKSKKICENYRSEVDVALVLYLDLSEAGFDFSKISM